MLQQRGRASAGRAGPSGSARARPSRAVRPPRSASVGASAQAQASSTAPRALAGASRWPSRPTSGRLPTTARPPTMLETARPTTSARITVGLASALATKIRRGERTATSRWRQVPSRSSAAKTSPATSEVSSGSAQVHAKPSTTREAAHPVANIQRPKTVSLGSELCPLMAATKSAGASQQATRTIRTRHCASSLSSSKRQAGAEAGGTGHEGRLRPLPRAATGGLAVVVLIGRPPATRGCRRRR